MFMIMSFLVLGCGFMIVRRRNGCIVMIRCCWCSVIITHIASKSLTPAYASALSLRSGTLTSLA